MMSSKHVGMYISTISTTAHLKKGEENLVFLTFISWFCVFVTLFDQYKYQQQQPPIFLKALVKKFLLFAVITVYYSLSHSLQQLFCTTSDKKIFFEFFFQKSFDPLIVIVNQTNSIFRSISFFYTDLKMYLLINIFIHSVCFYKPLSCKLIYEANFFGGDLYDLGLLVFSFLGDKFCFF